MPATGSAVDVTAADVTALDVTVLSFNIAIGGEAVDLAVTAEAIRRSGADIVGLQEAGANAPRIATLLGWAHVDERHQVISRWPIAEPHDGLGHHVYVHVRPDAVVAVGNVHLPSDPYGPYELRDGASIDEVIELETRLRLRAFDRHVPAWDRVLDAGLPLVVTGDFNTPAHTDWGADAGAHRTTAVAWPVSLAADALGLADTYRVANPDRPGISWTYGFPHPRVDPDELTDRIDFVWAASRTGGVEILESALVGPSGVPDVEIAVDPWPSDHLGVATRLRVVPASPPAYVSLGSRRLEQGDRLAVRFHAPGGAATDRLHVVDAGDGSDGALLSLAPMEVEHFGVVYFGTPMPPGPYEVVLTCGDDEIGRSPFQVVAPGERPALAAQRSDGAIVVAWTAAPGRKHDWIGIYRLGDPHLEDGIVARRSTRAAVAGTLRFDDVAPGAMVARLFTDDSYVIVAETVVA